MRLRLEAIVELDDNLCDLEDEDQRAWMWRLLDGTGDGGPLVLHSDEVGDDIGTVVFPRVES